MFVYLFIFHIFIYLSSSSLNSSPFCFPFLPSFLSFLLPPTLLHSKSSLLPSCLLLSFSMSPFVRAFLYSLPPFVFPARASLSSLHSTPLLFLSGSFLPLLILCDYFVFPLFPFLLSVILPSLPFSVLSLSFLSISSSIRVPMPLSFAISLYHIYLPSSLFLPVIHLSLQ